jgi:predicted DNA-binding helix-hairpin-helix protein
MDTQRKLEILAQDAQYDLACACGTRDDEHRRRGVGGKWLYPVTLPNGGRSLLLKTLVSNACTNDCKYCPLRRGSNVERCSMSADEIANIFLEYRRTENVFGLFLTSGVTGTPDQGMERLLDATKLLRRKHQFRGYIHLKILPGASAAAIEEAVRFASAVSLNIETPGREHFAKLSACKDYDRDPKETWARAHPECFPLNANKAERAQLLRVPGLGLLGVARVLEARLHRTLRSLADAGLRGRLAAKAEPYLVWS